MGRSAKPNRNTAISSRSRRDNSSPLASSLLAATEREDALKALEQGKAALEDFDGRAFFEALLQITMEGFFADPIYGGNRDKASWRMIGFPGLPAVYSKLIEEYRNKRYAAEPQSIADFS